MIHSRKAFAVLCGLKPNELSVYAARGKVVVVNGKVDDRVAENAEFLQNRKEKDGTFRVDVREKEFTKADLKKIERTEHHNELNTKKKELENKELEESIQLLRLKKEKQEGYLIPTSLVKDLFVQHFKSITVSFQQQADNLIIEISKKKS